MLFIKVKAFYFSSAMKDPYLPIHNLLHNMHQAAHPQFSLYVSHHQGGEDCQNTIVQQGDSSIHAVQCGQKNQLDQFFSQPSIILWPALQSFSLKSSHILSKKSSPLPACCEEAVITFWRFNILPAEKGLQFCNQQIVHAAVLIRELLF